MVTGELPDLPHLPELPGRGPGADMVGRAGGAAGRPARRPPAVRLAAGRPGRRWTSGGPAATSARTSTSSSRTPTASSARSSCRSCGPWTLAAALQLPRGEPVLTDPRRVRDLVASLTEGLLRHVADLRARLPGRGARAPAGRAVAAGGARRRGPLARPVPRTVAPVKETDAEDVLQRPGRGGGRPGRRALLRGPPAGGPAAPGRGGRRLASTSPCSARTWTTSSARRSSRGSSLLAGLVPAVAGGRGSMSGVAGYGRAGPAALAAARSRPAAARRPGGRHPHLRAGRGVPGRTPGPH